MCGTVTFYARTYTYMKKYTLLSALALALGFTACSHYDVDEEFPQAQGNVHITLSAPFNQIESRGPQSAEYTKADVLEDKELIETYYVVFTNKETGKIVHVEKKSIGTTGVESTQIDLDLRPGEYKVYAFANIPFSYLDGTDASPDSKKPGYNLTVDKTMPTDLTTASYLIPDEVMKSGKSFMGKCFVPVEDVEMVPMTGKAEGQAITVTERANQTFGIEVVRMLGKVQFDFRNPTNADLKINGIKMSDLTVNDSKAEDPNKRDGATLLMNYLDLYTGHSGFLTTPINRPDGIKTRTLFAHYETPLDLPKDSTQSVSFYVLESKAKDYPSETTDSTHIFDKTFIDNTFDLDFDLDTDPSSGLGDSIRYAITKPNNFTTIHRNDWIVIPVVINEWVLRLEALSYPPIGGYPEAKVDADNSGNFHVTFSSPGDIALSPVIHKFYSPSDYFYLNDPTRVVSYTLEPKPAWNATNSILASEPKLDHITGQIITTLNDKKGAVELTLTVTFKSSLDPVATKTMTSQILIAHI